MPGITRHRRGRFWAYFDAAGNRITDRDEIDRLNAIGLPPAYTDAWFCLYPNGHLQATGKDVRGRTQYRYHPDFRASRDESKYAGCIGFGEALPRIRRKVDHDLRRRRLDRERVVAAVVKLLDEAMIRVGNPEYARANRSFGATTLRTRHVRWTGGRPTMRFRGKHGIVREVTITDRTLATVVRRCQELPGQNLFQWIDSDGQVHDVTSTDVNAYIREASGGDFTAKHFRTWGASVIAFEQLLEAGEQRIRLNHMIAPVAEALGNTPAISRKAYVHPRLIAAIKERPSDPLNGLSRPRPRKWLSSAEVGLLQFLRAAAGGRRRRRPPAGDGLIPAGAAATRSR